jgi:septum formation inhibitor MinC
MEFKVQETLEWANLQKSINALHGVEAKVGWFENATYDNKDKTPVATVAMIQEHGAIIAPHHKEKFQEDIKSINKKIQKFAKKNNYQKKIKGVIVIPPRPFFGPALIKNAQKFNNMLLLGSKQVLEGEKTIEKVFRELASETRNSIQKEIKLVTSPPLSEATIKKRLSRRKNKTVTGTLTKPLIDTRVMIRTVSYRVNKA